MKFSKNRLEAFSDGVMAIIVTIMVLYIPLPSSFGLAEIELLLASILVFFVSFFVAGLYWLQHYHLLSRVEEIPSMAAWRNLLFLFCLALLPLFTKWVIDNFGQVVPAVGYAVVFILVNLSYQFMFSSMLNAEDKERFRSAGIYSWWRIALWGAVIVGAVVLSVFSPRVATIVLIGLPLVGSLSNLLFEPQPRRGDSREALTQRN